MTPAAAAATALKTKTKDDFCNLKRENGEKKREG